MKVLHVLDHSLPLQSGYVFRTQGILTEQRALGIETFHVTSGKQGFCATDEERIEGFVFHRTRPSASALDRLPGGGQWQIVASLRRRLSGLIDAIRPDLIHAHSPCLNGLAALSAGRRHGIPVVYELRASWEDAAVSHGSTREGSLRYRLSRALETHVLRRADHVVTICEGLKNDSVSRGVPESRITVVPNAVDRELLAEHPLSAATRDLLARLSDRRIVGFFGSFYDYEGLDLLLDAMPEVIRRHPNVLVLLLGSGPQDAALKSRSKALGLEGHVMFAGRVAHHDIPAVYRGVEVFIFPRKPMRLTEIVTPLKPLEAMAAGALVVASDVGGHKELIADGETGLLFPAGDVHRLAATLARALDAPEAWVAVRETARRRVLAERVWTAVGRRYLDAYEKVGCPLRPARAGTAEPAHNAQNV